MIKKFGESNKEITIKIISHGTNVKTFDIPVGAFCTHPRMRSISVKGFRGSRVQQVSCKDCGLEWQSGEGEHG